MTPERYESWYRTPRGEWIGGLEWRLVERVAGPLAGAWVLDLGSGTGHFTRRAAAVAGVSAIGVDPNRGWVRYAQGRGAGARYVVARAEALPFRAHAFDVTVSVAALCFVTRIKEALAEAGRVTRGAIALGLLNRRSVLWWRRGRPGGQRRAGGPGGYEGAHWYTCREARALADRVWSRPSVCYSAVFLPGGGSLARSVEQVLPARLLLGAFLVISVAPSRAGRGTGASVA